MASLVDLTVTPVLLIAILQPVVKQKFFQTWIIVVHAMLFAPQSTMQILNAQTGLADFLVILALETVIQIQITDVK